MVKDAFWGRGLAPRPNENQPPTSGGTLPSPAIDGTWRRTWRGGTSPWPAGVNGVTAKPIFSSASLALLSMYLVTSPILGHTRFSNSFRTPLTSWLLMAIRTPSKLCFLLAIPAKKGGRAEQAWAGSCLKGKSAQQESKLFGGGLGRCAQWVGKQLQPLASWWPRRKY